VRVTENVIGSEAVNVNLQTWGGIECVRVQPGKFLMGSKEDKLSEADDEKPQHTVELSQEFWIGHSPVTNAQYAGFIQASGSRGKSRRDVSGKEDHPVVGVSWNDAQEFCEWMNQTHDKELPQGWQFRLPTEAEWEKAARGEYGNEWPWGSEWDPQRCNTSDSSPRPGHTTPVGKYPLGASPYGAFDMAGNVWEWCADWYDSKEYARRAGGQVIDPKGPDSGEMRVMRGGSWSDDRHGARCACRSGSEQTFFFNNLGFRLVVSPR
jgi:formylglycine-generating enzyme required for sulfatase activity